MNQWDSGGRRPEHATDAWMRWLAFIVLAMLLLGGTAFLLIAIYRWIF